MLLRYLSYTLPRRGAGVGACHRLYACGPLSDWAVEWSCSVQRHLPHASYHKHQGMDGRAGCPENAQTERERAKNSNVKSSNVMSSVGLVGLWVYFRLLLQFPYIFCKFTSCSHIFRYCRVWFGPGRPLPLPQSRMALVTKGVVTSRRAQAACIPTRRGSHGPWFGPADSLSSSFRRVPFG